MADRDDMGGAGSEVRTLDEVLSMHPLLGLAWKAARGAGQILLEDRPLAIATSSKSSPTDVVTEMDTRSERFLADTLLGSRPADGMLGEEGGERLGTSGVRWVVDPLDGTVNYLYRLPMWGVSIGVEVDGSAQAGVVLTPEFDEGYVAVRGHGAWHLAHGRATRMRIDDVSDMSMALVATGFGYRWQQRKRQAEVVRELLPRIRDLRRSGSAVIDFCWLARSRVDAFYEDGLNEWDLAAGALIAQEAGAIVGGLDGGAYRGGVLLASKPGVADQLRSALVEAGAGGEA
jgi:myo-inositol-1(or 4)-monophosphatase